MPHISEFDSKPTKTKEGFSSSIPIFCLFSFSRTSLVICMALYLTVPTALVQSTYPRCRTTKTHGDNSSLSEWPLDVLCCCCSFLWTVVFVSHRYFAFYQEQWMNHSSWALNTAPKWARILHNSSTWSNFSFASVLRESQGKFMLNA